MSNNQTGRRLGLVAAAIIAFVAAAPAQAQFATGVETGPAVAAPASAKTTVVANEIIVRRTPRGRYHLLLLGVAY